MNKVPTSSIFRVKTVVEGALSIGRERAVVLVKRPFLSEDNYEKLKEENTAQIAEILFEKISVLKGTAVKIAQSLAMHNVLPYQVHQTLQKSYNRIEPISKVVIMQVLKAEYGKDYKKVFAHFNLHPFAAASLGQVHEARTFDGKRLAIKVQYPGIDKTIRSDLELMKNFMRFHDNLAEILDEVRVRILEEVDYKKELQNYRWAYERFNTPTTVVPKVYEDFCTPHIIAADYIEGVDLLSWLESRPPMRQKKQIANAIWKVFVESVFDYRKIQADPNPGNYLVTNDGRLALVDFGCMKSFSEEFISLYKRLFQSAVTNKKDEILALYRQAGFLDVDEERADKAYRDVIEPFNRWAVEPLLCETFVFSKAYLEKGVEFAARFSSKPFNINKDFIFLDRTLHGLYALFERMGVPVDMRPFRQRVGL